MSKFIKGTMILMVAGFITRILGFLNRIVIARMIGAEGVGLYMMSFPTLTLVITITQIGLPVAISKAVAEAEARNDRKQTKKILAVSLTVTGILSLIFTPSLMLAAPFLANTLFTDSRIFYPLITITPIIPIVAIAAVLRGYFLGKQNMQPAAVSLIIEQVVRIGLIIFITQFFIPYGIEYAAAAAMGASVIGELASLLYMYFMFKRKKKFPLRKNFIASLRGGKETLKSLMNVALPTTGSRMIGSISWFLEPIVVSQSLLLAGVVASIATQQYGILTGYALPLLMLPSFITQSLSTALVPAISEAYAKKNIRAVEHRLQEALRFILLTGGLAIVILYVYAEPIMKILYGDSKGFEFIQMIAPFCIFSYCQGPLQAILQALNLARAAMINSLIGSVIKISLIFFLASNPQFGINGVAIAIIAGMVVVTVLHFATVLKAIHFTIYLRVYLKFGLATVITGLVGFFFSKHVVLIEEQIINMFIGMILVVLTYILAITSLKLLTKNDLGKLPGFNRFFK